METQYAVSWSCDLTKEIMKRFQYKNVFLDEPIRHIYTYKGEVSFETDEGSTAFHGEFTESLCHYNLKLQFTFHWRGNPRHMKTTVVCPFKQCKDGSRVYAGFDSLGRQIHVQEDGSAVWCNTCECWHWLKARAHVLGLLHR